MDMLAEWAAQKGSNSRGTSEILSFFTFAICPIEKMGGEKNKSSSAVINSYVRVWFAVFMSTIENVGACTFSPRDQQMIL